MRLILPELQGSGKRNRQLALLGPWLIFVAVCGAIAAIFSLVTTQGGGVSTGFSDRLFYCDTSDKIRYAYADDAFDRISPYWDSNLFLYVTMGIHGLTYTQAKAIDICFDLIVGRGSQVLLALALYPLLRRAVLRSMEVREFSVALVLPFFMERLSVFTLWSMITNMRTVRKKDPEPEEQIARSRFRVDWRITLIILVGCYILAIPTFLSAMTSYQARGQPYFPINNGSSYMSAEDVKIPAFFVKGGEQIGLSPNYPVYNTSDSRLYATLDGYDRALYKAGKLYRMDWRDFYGNHSTDANLAYNYNHAHIKPSTDEELATILQAQLDFNRTRDSLPLQQNITDPQTPPTWSLQIWPRNATWGELRHFPTLEDCCLDSTIVVQNTTYNLNTSIKFEYNIDSQGNANFATKYIWDDRNTTALGVDLAAIGICLPSKEYVWGFSSLMLFTFCMLTVAVLLLLIVLHYDAYLNSMADRYRLQISTYRDVLDIADELRSHYGEAEVSSMSTTELDKAMQKDPATIGLETTTLHKTRAARWKQGRRKPKMPTWRGLRRKSEAVESSRTDAEVSLMSIGLEAHAPEFEMGKLPVKAVTKQFD